MRRFLARLARLACLALPVATAACADDSTVTVKYAQGYTPGPAPVSLLGVFRDGRMSIDTWLPMANLVSAMLGATGAESCEPAYGTQLQHEHEEIFASIDSDVRDNGITEDLLNKLAPRAQGDLILTISVHGSIGQTADTPRTGQQGKGASPPPTMRGMGGGGRGGRGAMGGQTREGAPRSPGLRPLELSASLFSIRQHIPVARLRMTYSGTSNDEALRRFATEIAALAPGSKCKGWTWPKDMPASVAPLLEGP